MAERSLRDDAEETTEVGVVTVHDLTDQWQIQIRDEGVYVEVRSLLDREGLLYLANALHYAMGRLPFADSDPL